MYLNIYTIIIILQLQCWVGLECNIIYILLLQFYNYNVGLG